MASPSRAATVKQTPLTATLSPRASSPARSVAIRNRNPAASGLTSATLPSASIRPVNITLDEHVVSNRLGSRLDQITACDNRIGQPLDRAWTENVRGHEELD